MPYDGRDEPIERDPPADDMRLFEESIRLPLRQEGAKALRWRHRVGDVFFEERREQSRIKTEIVVKYLRAWAKIMVEQPPNYRAAYIDLFAGAGRYKDGEPSTPVRVLEYLCGDESLAGRVVTYFNEGRKKIFDQLKVSVAGVERLSTLSCQPILVNEMIDEEAPKLFEGQALIPSLLFADPWGYKGLTLRLIRSVLKDWGSECIFFFNYNRIYMGLNNVAIASHVDAIFGKTRADKLRAFVNQAPRPDAIAREAGVLEALRDALTEIEGTFSLPFRFRRSQNKTSHYLIYVTKNRLGHNIMKEVMASVSSSKTQGVASFDFVLPDEGHGEPLSLVTPLDDLQRDLLRKYANKQLNVRAIFDDHNIGTPYTMTNYKEALKVMFSAGAVSCKRSSGKAIRVGTMPEDVVVTFP